MPSWPDGPFLSLREYPELTIAVRQLAGLARDAIRFRAGLGLTATRFARRARLDVGTYTDFEAGRTWPSPLTLYKIAEALGTELRYVGRRPGS